MAKTKTTIFNHLMVDIETMGSSSFSSIVSIGAVEFDIETGKTGREFYINVDLQSCLDLGLTMDGNTVIWWMKQSEKARASLYNDCQTITNALHLFSQFCKDRDYQMWGNSARFDLGLLTDAYSKTDIPIPWKFYNERCVRTLVSFKPEIKKSYPAPSIAHNAISDCKYQIGYCSATWNKLNKK